MNSFEKYIHLGDIVAKSQAMLDVLEIVKTVAGSDATVLIYGETGTGKEVIAKAIHNLSSRKDRPFAAVNCAAVPETLLESEFFGHEKGSFTGAYDRKIGKFEAASSGTIFLDEIGSIPPSIQAKLLRSLQEKKIERIGSTETIPVDIRIISASNVDLLEAIKKGVFREDLYYRLNVIKITLPPLRERPEDIPLLLDYFLEKQNKKFNKNVKGFSEDVSNCLQNYDWPGNIRELENIVERVVALSKENLISIDQLPKEIVSSCESTPSVFEAYEEGGKRKEVEVKNLSANKSEFESIKDALKKAGGNKSKAAAILGVHRNTLLKKLKSFGIQL